MSHPDTDVHAPPPDSFVSNFTVILLLLVAFTFAIFYAAGLISRSLTPEVPDPALVALANERIKPVGKVRTGAPAPAQASAAAAAGPADGEQVYQSACVSCHTTGAAGAPKHGDKEAWAPRLAQGVDTLYQHSLQGYKAMPPKGGFTNLTDAQVKAAVDYMTEAVQ